MPYTTVVAGTTITAAWGNANVRDQVVTPFASRAARDSAITSPVAGMITYIASGTNQYDQYTGGAWQRLDWNDAWGVIGGRDYGYAGAVMSTGISTTEFAPGSADVTAVSLIAGRRYALNYLLRGIRSTTGDIETRIRDTNLSGTVRLYQHSYAMNGTQSYPLIGSGRYTCTVNETKTFVFTINTLGSGTVDVYREGGGFFEVMDLGPASVLTSSP